MKTKLLPHAGPYLLPLIAIILLSLTAHSVQAQARINNDKALQKDRAGQHRDRHDRDNRRVENNHRDGVVSQRGNWSRPEHRDYREHQEQRDHQWHRNNNQRQGNNRYTYNRDHRNQQWYRPLTVRRYINHYIPLSFAGLSFYYSNGHYYRRNGTGFSLVFNNVGSHIRYLPFGHRKVYIHNYPYYYVNRRYYIHDHARDVYVHVSNPYEYAAVEEPVAANSYQELYIYPQQGQTAEQVGEDRFECHTWAVSQTGFDPSLGQPGDSDDYRRAQSACLEGRGYVVN